MSDIKFVCASCQQHLEAPEAMAGETVSCPSCQKPLTVPAPQAAPKVAPAACPGCGTPLDAGVVLCVKCGYHQGLGKKLSTDFR
jgi:hypothetical protein